MFFKAHTGPVAVSLATVLFWGNVVAAPPNDPYYQDQSAPTQRGLKQINPEPAWACSKGRNVVVAVLDSGLVLHPEDSPASVLPGMDFIQTEDGGVATSVDPNGHGTHLTGIIAAATDNGRGIASVAPQATILPLRVLRENLVHKVNGTGADTELSTIQGLKAAAQYSEDQQVNVVINASFGSTLSNGYCNALQTIAQNPKARVLVVAAAMNSGLDEPHYPAACTLAGVDNLLSVGSVNSSTNLRDRVASYSNRGCWVNTFAPGSEVMSTWSPEIPPRGGVTRYENGIYATWFGTSQAAAFVSGAAAVLWSMAPEKTAAEIVTLLRQSADPVFSAAGAALDDCSDPSRNQHRGRINLGEAMKSIDGSQCTQSTEHPPSPPQRPGNFTVEME
ncbi:MAG: S8 family serine peptidase [Pseudomonadota bacterium]|nr:S8 family serine peptidase [Pseudomonadota bacterium]